MTARVLLHIGLPKTGTTYLQRILWSNRPRLGEDGIWLPGRNRRDHLWAALECMGDDVARRSSRAPGALARLCDEIAGDKRPTALISHEFFCGASREQAAGMLDRLAPARVDLIVTARDAGAMLAAGWQELVKNGSTLTLEQAARRRSGSEFSWQTWDLGGVLERWGPLVPADRVHVLPMPAPGSPPDQHWHNFAQVIGSSSDMEMPAGAVNTSLGVVQVELLRRITPLLGAFKQRPVDRGEWIRGYLAETRLAAQPGERFGLPPDLAADCAARSKRALALIERAGYHVVGDARLLVPSEDALPRRDPATVSDAELVESAAQVIASMLADVRDAQSRRVPDEAPAVARLWRVVPERLRRMGSDRAG